MYYIIVTHGSFSSFNVSENSNHELKTPVSVIICARNEANNLLNNLNSILSQDYPNYEVIVVNDCSFDSSEDILKEFSSKYPDKLKVVNIEEHPRYKTAKKFAVTMGIKASNFDYLLFTDADCMPENNQWIKEIMQGYVFKETEIVLGYSPYIKKRGLLNKFIRFETFFTALNYFSFAIKRNAYMGVGRNLSYKKSLFFKGKGFASHMHIPSGDDDLFVNQHANQKNTSIVVSQNSWVWSHPKTTLGSYWRQKMRHNGAGKSYRSKHQYQLLFQFLSGLLFYALFIVLLAIKIQEIFIVGIFICRMIIQHVIYYKSMKKLGSIDLIKWLFILDPCYYIIMGLLNLFGLFRKQVTWK